MPGRSQSRRREVAAGLRAGPEATRAEASVDLGHTSKPARTHAPAILPSGDAGQWENDVFVLGGKAQGLVRLPAEWTPPFVVLTSEFTRMVRSTSPRAAFHDLSALAKESVEKLLTECRIRRQDTTVAPKILVRSNAVEESGLTSRGLYRSLVSEPELDSILEAVGELLEMSPQMRVVLQGAVYGINGHLSNERRVSGRRDRGLVEGLRRSSSRGGLISSSPFRDGPLNARTLAQAEQRLREVLDWMAHRFSGSGAAEWVWDGERLWVVQMDEVTSQTSHGDVVAYLRARPRRYKSRAIRIEGATHFEGVDGAEWQKLSRALRFRCLGLPAPSIYVSTGDSWTEESGLQLCRELVASNQGMWVIRTDVAKSSGANPDLLPTSDPTDDPLQLAAFMTRTAHQFADNGLNPHEWAFLSAPLVEAHVSVMAFARPNKKSVQIDTLWGFPDGLMYLPHDSFTFRDDGSIDSHVRYKPACMLLSEKRWRTLNVGPPYDRERTLNSDEVRGISEWARIVADDIGAPVSVMILARIGGARGIKSCLPFHYFVGEIPAPAPISYEKKMTRPFLVREAADILKVEQRADIRALALQPTEAASRDLEFIRKVADIAVSRDIPIFFDGSLLAHAYHVMASRGAAIVPAGGPPRLGAVIPYDKLVRDAIPAIIEQTGGLARVRTLSPREAQPLLRRKLVEEAIEALTASETTLVDELADLEEVIDAIARFLPGGREAIESSMKRKRAERGGFQDLVFLEATADRPVGAPMEFAIEPGRKDQLTMNTKTVGAKVEGIVSFEIALPMIPPHQIGGESRRIDLNPSQVMRVIVSYEPPLIRVKALVEETKAAEQPTLFDIDDPSGTGAGW